MAVPRTFTYKVYRDGSYLGDLPNVTSEFGYSEDINAAGSQLVVKMGLSADVSGLPPSIITTEDDAWIVDETEVYAFTNEAADDVVGENGDNILIRNGNRLKVWMYDQYYPNGLLRFSGEIEKWPAKFAALGPDEIGVVAYSDGQDLNNYIIPGTNSLVLDQSTSVSSTHAPFTNIGPIVYGQTITPGGGVTNVGAITLNLNSTSSSNLTVKVWNSQADYFNASPLAVATMPVVSATYADYQFIFSTPATVGATYFFTINTDNPSGTNIGGDFVGSYPNFVYTEPGHTGSNFVSLTGSLYFKTYYSLLTTQATFSAQDPSTMVMSIVDIEHAQGGLVTYAPGSIDMTGLSVPYDFNLATVYEGVAKGKELAPYDFYWYVDVGSSVLNFKRTSTTADIILQKGVHVGELNLVATIENVKNFLYFSGGDIGGGVNLFKTYSDPDSIARYGLRIERMSDNRVKQDVIADAIGRSFIDAHKGQQYETTVTVSAATMDTTVFKPGKTIGFRGYGNFIDQLVIRTSHLDFSSDDATASLGTLPPRVSVTLQQALANITALQTIANPNSPS